MTFAVDQIDHVELFVRDLEASVRWYADVLGLSVCRRYEPHPVMIGAGNTMLALFKADPNAAPVISGKLATPLRWRRVAWRTSPKGFQQAQEHLTRKGVEFSGPIDHDGPWSIYFNDPDGHPLEITYYPE